MSVLWERLAGDTNKFAFKISFRTDPDGGLGATAEESLSWGSFQIWAAGQNLCIHSESAGDTTDSANWYLLPLLEWFATNWDPLFHEERFPMRNAGAESWSALRNSAFPLLTLDEDQASEWGLAWHEWWGRHNVQAARDGGLFPDVYVRRWRDLIEVSWGPTRLPGAPEDFRFWLQNGYARLKPLQVAEPLHEVVLEAAKYMRTRLPQSQRLTSLVKNIERIRRGDEEKRLAWLAGLGKLANDYVRGWKKVRGRFKKELRGEIEAVFGAEHQDLLIGGSCQAALMFGSVSPAIDAKDAINLAEQMVRHYSTKGDPGQLREHISTEPLEADEKIWDQGYRLADRLLKAIKLPASGQSWIDVKTCMSKMGVSVDMDFELRDSSIRAVSIAGPQHTPAVLVNKNHESNKSVVGQRFTLAHELCHIMYARTFAKALAIASGPWAPVDVEKRANAFAAMFLMPSGLVKNALAHSTEPLNSWKGISEVARCLRTSPSATLEHLTNIGHIDESTHDRLRYELESKIDVEI